MAPTVPRHCPAGTGVPGTKAGKAPRNLPSRYRCQTWQGKRCNRPEGDPSEARSSSSKRLVADHIADIVVAEPRRLRSPRRRRRRSSAGILDLIVAFNRHRRQPPVGGLHRPPSSATRRPTSTAFFRTAFGEPAAAALCGARPTGFGSSLASDRRYRAALWADDRAALQVVKFRPQFTDVWLPQLGFRHFDALLAIARFPFFP